MKKVFLQCIKPFLGAYLVVGKVYPGIYNPETNYYRVWFSDSPEKNQGEGWLHTPYGTEYFKEVEPEFIELWTAFDKLSNSIADFQKPFNTTAQAFKNFQMIFARFVPRSISEDDDSTREIYLRPLANGPVRIDNEGTEVYIIPSTDEGTHQITICSNGSIQDWWEYQ